MLYVICYDIADDRRRRRLEKALKDFGHRVQESVFEAELDEKPRIEMQRQIEKEVDFSEDTVRIYRQCGTCRLTVEVIGLGPTPAEGPDILVV